MIEFVGNTMTEYNIWNTYNVNVWSENKIENYHKSLYVNDRYFLTSFYGN